MNIGTMESAGSYPCDFQQLQQISHEQLSRLMISPDQAIEHTKSALYDSMEHRRRFEEASSGLQLHWRKMLVSVKQTADAYYVGISGWLHQSHEEDTFVLASGESATFASVASERRMQEQKEAETWNRIKEIYE